MCQQDFDFGCVRSVGKMERRRESYRSEGVVTASAAVDDSSQHQHSYSALRRNKSNNNMINPSVEGNSLEDGSQGREISGLDHQLPSMEQLERTGNSRSSSDSNATARCLSCSQQRRDDYSGNDFRECHQHQLQKKQQNHHEENKSKLLCGQGDRASTCWHSSPFESAAYGIEIDTSSPASSSNLTLQHQTTLPSVDESPNGTLSAEDGLAKITSERKKGCRRESSLFVGLSRALWIQLGMLILFSLDRQGVTAVRINSLSVPHIIRNGTEDSVILDCDYSIDDNEKLGLVVKWYFNDQQVYQWIPNEKPIILGVLKGKVSLDDQADVDDEYKVKRALKIMRPTTELSGNWICKVSSFEGEAMKTARMTVFAPEKEMDMQVVANRRSEFVNISCWATRVFPQPKMTFYHEGEEVEGVVETTEENDGAFDVRAFKVLQGVTLSSLIGSAFDCQLVIPPSLYVTKRTTAFEPGSLELKDAMRMSHGQPRVLWESRGALLALPLATIIFSYL